ncbi:hypothetical protein KR51_00001110 [Rubidibacter lacunae KORDI 51-2]|uniref:Hemolysin-type calcium-binding repeat (2 copies) n=1 Tax=Rubidibacter lacunae KORDI 51-2 TaxID=582515 RepID=U5DRH6_9CHRO|nr:hypothetical protein [Rubidibacter lacunae]ERN43214.1 hypothetical protein KR51_00001110 [Rubidibacter lacunae KORDI 51-2]
MTFISGTCGDDFLFDNPFDVDFIVARGGDDTIFLSNDGFDDTVLAQSGDDTILIGDRTGNNTIDGGSGVDTVDYSALGESITLNALGKITKASGGVDRIQSVEVIIGAIGAGIVNTIDGSPVEGFNNTGSFNVNLANNSLIISGSPGGPLSFTVQNFTNVVGTQNDDTITGDEQSNTFFGSLGNDTFNGGSLGGTTLPDNAIDTVDYSDLGLTISLENLGLINKIDAEGNVIGTDQIVGLGFGQLTPSIERIVGGQDLNNIIDGSEVGGFGNTGSFKIDLGANSLVIKNVVPGIDQAFEVVNFVDVRGTKNDDIIIGSSKDNTFFGSKGSDSFSGGGGFNTIDYTGANVGGVTLNSLGTITKGIGGVDRFDFDSPPTSLVVSIDRLVGDATETNTINGATTAGFDNTVSFDIDLGANSLILNDVLGTDLVFEVVNFDNVIGTQNDDTIVGNDRDNVFFGSDGNDTYNGSAGADVLDYSTAGLGLLTIQNGGSILKNFGDFGTDQIFGENGDLFDPSVESIIGTNGQFNIIDGTPIPGVGLNTGSFNIDLRVGNVTIDNLPGGNSLQFNTQNFVDVVGTQNDDVIRGDNGTNILIGGAGDDALFGEGSSSSALDFLTGVEGTLESDPVTGNFNIDFGPAGSNPGQGEIDLLTGGSGPDRFILGDATSGPFYVGGGNNDFAFISDFEPGVDRMVFDPNTPVITVAGTLGDFESFWDLNFNGILDSADDLFAVTDLADSAGSSFTNAHSLFANASADDVAGSRTFIS